MKNMIKVPVRVFPIYARDERTGGVKPDTIVFTKDQLQAAQKIGLSATELIYRQYNRAGYRVTRIGEVIKQIVEVEISVGVLEKFGKDVTSVIVEGDASVEVKSPAER